MNAAEIVAALGGRNGMARCPAHDDRTPSLSVAEGDNGKVLLKCFAGCGQAEVMDALTRQGLWNGSGAAIRHVGLKHKINRRSTKPRSTPKLPDNHQKALEIWRATQPIDGTLAERYLIERGIVPPDLSPLRFHSALDYFDNGAPGWPVKLPALIAAVQSSAGNMTGVQRIFLNPAGGGKAQVADPKKCLGTVAGGAVRLAPAAPTLTLTEGVEDGLALMQMTGAACWALPGTSNFNNFIPPPEIKTIVLAPDADTAGDKLVAEAAERFSGMGLRVLHLRPPDGCDWCDVLADYEERCAIREFDSGEDRAEAELAAFAEIIGGGLAGA